MGGQPLISNSVLLHALHILAHLCPKAEGSIPKATKILVEVVGSTAATNMNDEDAALRDQRSHGCEKLPVHIGGLRLLTLKERQASVVEVGFTPAAEP